MCVFAKFAMDTQLNTNKTPSNFFIHEAFGNFHLFSHSPEEARRGPAVVHGGDEIFLYFAGSILDIGKSPQPAYHCHWPHGQRVSGVGTGFLEWGPMKRL